MEYPLIFSYCREEYTIDESVAFEFIDMTVEKLNKGIQITEEDFQKYIYPKDVQPAIKALYFRHVPGKKQEFYWRFTDADYYDDINSMSLYAIEELSDGTSERYPMFYIDLTEYDCSCCGQIKCNCACRKN